MLITSLLIFQEWLPTFETNGEGHANLPNYDFSKFVANPDGFLQDQFLDVGMYPNALDLYKDDPTTYSF